MNWLEHHTASRLRHVTECKSYVIAADVPTAGHEPWWIARHASGREVASGYGDAGLAKCRSFCELDARREQPAESTLPVEQPPTRVETTAPTPSPTHVPTTSAQSALF